MLLVSRLLYYSSHKPDCMESAQILQADVLDIIFDDRNKAYGAYELRRHYRARLTKAIGGMVLFTGLSLTTYLLLANSKKGDDSLIVDKTVTLVQAPEQPQPKEVIQIPPPAAKPEPLHMEQLTSHIQIVDEEVEAPLPEQTTLDNAIIGTHHEDGSDVVGNLDAPVAEAKGVVDAPKSQDDDANKIFTRVEIESEYPGGKEAWATFLNRHLQYPQDAIDIEVQGTVIIEFVVDKEGNVSNIVPVSGPQELQKAAVAVIKQSGQWKPAIQNGRNVNSYKRQPITFKLPE